MVEMLWTRGGDSLIKDARGNLQSNGPSEMDMMPWSSISAPFLSFLTNPAMILLKGVELGHIGYERSCGFAQKRPNDLAILSSFLPANPTMNAIPKTSKIGCGEAAFKNPWLRSVGCCKSIEDVQ